MGPRGRVLRSSVLNSTESRRPTPCAPGNAANLRGSHSTGSWHWNLSFRLRNGRTRSASTFETHHALHGRLALFRDLILLSGYVSATFTQLLGFAANLHGHELVAVFTTALACCHANDASEIRRLFELPSLPSPGHPPLTSKNWRFNGRGCLYGEKLSRSFGCASGHLFERSRRAVQRLGTHPNAGRGAAQQWPPRRLRHAAVSRGLVPSGSRGRRTSAGSIVYENRQ